MFNLNVIDFISPMFYNNNNNNNNDNNNRNSNITIFSLFVGLPYLFSILFSQDNV